MKKRGRKRGEGTGWKEIQWNRAKDENVITFSSFFFWYVRAPTRLLDFFPLLIHSLLSFSLLFSVDQKERERERERVLFILKFNTSISTKEKLNDDDGCYESQVVESREKDPSTERERKKYGEREREKYGEKEREGGRNMEREREEVQIEETHPVL